MMDLVSKTSSSSSQIIGDTIEKAKDWALINGLTLRPRTKLADSVDRDRLEFIPFTLLPSQFPRFAYEEARAVQPLVNELMYRVAQDDEFLRESLTETARHDDFTRRLLDILLATAQPQSQHISLGLLRSDYMLDAGRERESILDACQEDEEVSMSGRWAAAKVRCKQVEVNTIASGQGWIGTICSRLHRYTLREMDLPNCSLANMPENNPLEGLCSGMLQAWRIYNNPSAAILFVVEETTVHICDQRQHEYQLRRAEPRICVLRRNLSQLGTVGRARLQGSDQRLLVDGREIALVYYRSAYAPSQYPSEAEWRARLMIERSRAIKCPSIGYHLAGTKKVQQLLAQPGCLERFLEPDDCERLRRIFTGLYALDFNELGEAAIEMALENPHDFVLKPQREGGANNFFGEDLRIKLESMRYEAERNAWILMDLIVPTVQQNYLVRPGGEANGKLENVTSELGIFGVVMGDRDRILVNETVGHTLRTKLVEINEGGVTSGHGASDSPFLI